MTFPVPDHEILFLCLKQHVDKWHVKNSSNSIVLLNTFKCNVLHYTIIIAHHSKNTYNRQCDYMGNPNSPLFLGLVRNAGIKSDFSFSSDLKFGGRQVDSLLKTLSSRTWFFAAEVAPSWQQHHSLNLLYVIYEWCNQQVIWWQPWETTTAAVGV